MISGEEDREIFSDVASPDPLDEFLSWVGHPKSDAGDASPALSCYSSCGESDFERYCSANSFMGTASMCSSLGTCNDFLDSDLGSVRSLGVGEDRCIFENAGFGGRFPKNSTDRGCTDYSSDGRLEFCKVKNEIGNSVSAQEGRVVGFNKRSKSLPRHQENSSFDNNVENLTTHNFFNGSESLGNSAVNSMLNKADSGKDNAEGLVLSGDQGLLHSSVKHIPSKNIVSVQNNKKRLPHFGVLNASTVMQSGEDSPSNGASCREITKQGPDDMNRSHELNITSGISADGKEAGKLAEADEETSTGYEHTDDESSSMHYGSDDDQSIGPGDGINMAYYQKTKPDEENPLLINSTVAFGSDDWDNYESNLVNFTRGAGSVSPIFGGSEQVENVKEIHMNSCDVQAIYQSIENIDSCSVRSVYTLQDQSAQKASAGTDSNIVDGIAAVELRNAGNKEMSSLDKTEVSTGDFSGKPESNLKLNPFSDMAIRHRLSMAIKPPQDNVAGDLQNDVKDALPPVAQNDQETFLKRILTDSSMSKNPRKEYVAPNEAENLNVNEFYDDVVHEMEEILLDSEGSPGARFSKGNRASVSQPPKPFRDGSSTASTSGTNDACPQVSQPLKIDGIKVVGAKQKKGEVSLGERLVGVKEYTVYRLKVWSGKDQWEVERRYRDFVSLYRQLKTFFADNGQVLPSPWYEVEQESRKIFGNASPYVVRQRSALIQDSLRSILQCRLSFSTSSPMIWFLSPQNVPPSSSMLNSLVPLSSSAYHGETSMQGTSTLGKKISLIVQVPRRRSMKQLLEAQHYSCAGCHRYLNEGKTLLKEFVETFGWGKPRLCEYTGQLFCASCHTNDTAVLPARVLHFWDFTRYPVSQLAKSYLKSIYEQPMLCVSAVNPFLFSKVPALLHIMGIRKKIGAMLPYVRCPFRRSIHRGLGSRKYLIESNDFFALRDLVDLSKGPFAALPVMVENLCNKILEHITEQCLICCDVGVPCCAGQACEDPSSLIFPFQEAKIKRCRSCESAFHKTCFRKLRSCRCGAELEVEHDGSSTYDARSKASDEVDGALDLSAGKSNTGSTTRFLSGLFSRMGSEKTLLGRKDNNTVIVMGSFPPNYL